MRMTLATAITCLALGALCAAHDADATIKRPTDIPAQPLAPALQTLVKERDIQLVYRAELVVDRNTSGASGELTPIEALGQLLNGTGLTYRYLDNKTITILPLPSGDAKSKSPPPAMPARETTPTVTEAQKKSFWDRFRLAQAASGKDMNDRSTVAPENTDSGSPAAVEEIVVTAQKRMERLQDVPVPVSAIGADVLTQSNQLRFQDYYTRIPGVSLLQGFTQTPSVSIRGIGMTGGNPTVGITIDDVPFGASAGLAGGLVPDIDPIDLARVEVLRGPQGTLYGVNSMGGLIKFVTADPSTERMTGHIQATGSGIRNGDSIGYGLRGAANVPLTDTMALRVSGFTREDPGYVDNVRTGEEGVNRTRGNGGRVSFIWSPSPEFSINPSALIQDFRADGSSTINQGLADLQQNTVAQGGGYHSRYIAYSLVVKAEPGSASVTSVTGLNRNRNDYGADYTPFLGVFSENGLGAFPGFGFADTASTVHRESRKFSQEIRLTAPVGEHFEWLAGAFYTDEANSYLQDVYVYNPTGGARVGDWVLLDIPNKYREYAAFTDLTWKLNDRFDIQVGGRQSKNEQSQNQSSEGIYNTVLVGGSSTTVIAGRVKSEENAFTFLVTPRLRLTPETMLYARVASGYRPGGPNFNAALLGIPPKFDSDSIRNYEIGAKGSLLDRVLSYDVSIYDIEWQDIQLFLLPQNTAAGFNANGGKARSRGVDLTLEARPAHGLTLSVWGSLSDAKMRSVPRDSTLGARPGDRLPMSARFSGNLSIEQQIALSGNLSGHVGAEMSYVGERKGNFTGDALEPGPRQIYPSYTRVDLRAGVSIATWNVDAFVNNVADRRGLIGGGLGTFLADELFFIQPRTMGLSLSREF